MPVTDPGSIPSTPDGSLSPATVTPEHRARSKPASCLPSGRTIKPPVLSPWILSPDCFFSFLPPIHPLLALTGAPTCSQPLLSPLLLFCPPLPLPLGPVRQSACHPLSGKLLLSAALSHFFQNCLALSPSAASPSWVMRSSGAENSSADPLPRTQHVRGFVISVPKPNFALPTEPPPPAISGSLGFSKCSEAFPSDVWGPLGSSLLCGAHFPLPCSPVATRANQKVGAQSSEEKKGFLVMPVWPVSLEHPAQGCRQPHPYKDPEFLWPEPQPQSQPPHLSPASCLWVALRGQSRSLAWGCNPGQEHGTRHLPSCP